VQMVARLSAWFRSVRLAKLDFAAVAYFIGSHIQALDFLFDVSSVSDQASIFVPSFQSSD
jgi:hypothetical protein